MIVAHKSNTDEIGILRKVFQNYGKLSTNSPYSKIVTCVQVCHSFMSSHVPLFFTQTHKNQVIFRTRGLLVHFHLPVTPKSN